MEQTASPRPLFVWQQVGLTSVKALCFGSLFICLEMCMDFLALSVHADTQFIPVLPPLFPPPHLPLKKLPLRRLHLGRSPACHFQDVRTCTHLCVSAPWMSHFIKCLKLRAGFPHGLWDPGMQSEFQGCKALCRSHGSTGWEQRCHWWDTYCFSSQTRFYILIV